MNSIGFPNMFTSRSTNIVEDYDATFQDLELLLCSEQGELFGDPYFGVQLRKYIYNQNNFMLKDMLIDEIYSKLATFAPQLTVTRKDIDIVQKGIKLYIKIRAINKVDFTTNMYELVLFEDNER